MLEVNHPQADFLKAKTPFTGFVGGYRSGKTFIGCVRLWQLASAHPGIKLGYFAPTYPHVRDILYDTIAEVGELYGQSLGVPCTVDINTTKHLVTLYINGIKYATVKCKSMDNPYAIVGFDISHALVDEIDCMKKDKADDAWKKIVARMSSVRDDYPVNTVDFTTTPEGFNWMYDFFVRQLKEKPEMAPYYSLVKASTLQNESNLPADYIDKLYATYPDNLVNAYVNGEFVNLTGGTVYNQYTDKNRSYETIDDKDYELHIGMDFNVTAMAACVYVYRDGFPHCVDEFVGLYDTKDMIEHIKMRYPDKQINVYPDASGRNRKSNGADETDITLLEDAGFYVYADSVNPRVKTRVNSMNAMFCNAKGEHRLFVNRDTCPETHECLQQQVYNDRGEPDKKGGKDHQTDAAGYVISYLHPIEGNLSSHDKIKIGR